MKNLIIPLVFLSVLVMATPVSCAGISKTREENSVSKVSIAKDRDGSWRLIVNGEPYVIKGVEYSPDVVGNYPDKSNEWMNNDFNENGKCDGPYDSWVDLNRDNYQDINEDNVGDFQLLAEMGCNTIRIYHPHNINKNILRELYEKYGIMVIMGNFMGAYTVGSGADWETGTDYTDYLQKKNMSEDIRQMVLDFKDEPYILCWMLGNENDASGSQENSTLNKTNASLQPKSYAKFVNQVARMIKGIDPNHPVGVCNATYKMLTYYAKYSPALDIIGMNAYTGPYGFSTLWGRVKTVFDRPVIITEYGGDCYDQKKDEVDEDFQAVYHRNAWKDIENNTYLGKKAGNSIGGVAYGWLDKWWLCGSHRIHDIEIGAWAGNTKDGWFNDEWLGICGQGSGLKSPFLRQLRKVYFVYKDELWNIENEETDENCEISADAEDTGEDETEDVEEGEHNAGNEYKTEEVKEDIDEERKKDAAAGEEVGESEDIREEESIVAEEGEAGNAKEAEIEKKHKTGDLNDDQE